MSDTPMSEHTDRMTIAVDRLAQAIAEVWQVCDDRYDHERGIGAGGNLPEVLSYALGLAAVTLGLDRTAGYGLKYAAGFGFTHLGRVGKQG